MSDPSVFWGDDYEKLIKAFPEFVVPASDHKVSHFGINLPEGHHKLAEVFDFVKEEFGLTPILSRTQRKQVPANDLRHFTVDTRYEFDEQDIENAAFFIYHLWRSSKGIANSVLQLGVMSLRSPRGNLFR